MDGSGADAATYLAIYATVVATAVGLWTLFSGIFLDRARVRVKAAEGYLVKAQSGQLIMKGEDFIDSIGVPAKARTPVLEISILNRGRQSVEIRTVGQAGLVRHGFYADALGQIPFELGAERAKSVVLGAPGGYEHGASGRAVSTPSMPRDGSIRCDSTTVCGLSTRCES